MSLYFRLLWTFFISNFRSKVHPLGPCKTPFRCYPNDLDILIHMNNGRYLTLMDLARVDLMIRSGMAKPIKNKGYYPVVVAETIRFKKSIQVFQSFHIETEILGWDEKAFILQQKFLSGHTLLAEAYLKARFLKKSGGTVKPIEILELYGNPPTKPDKLPEWVAHWSEIQK